MTFDTNTRAFSLADAPVALTPREHAVLEALIRRAGQTVTKVDLVHSVFGFDDEAAPNAIEIYVHRVRKKLEGSPVTISTLRGIGYLLRCEQAARP